MFALHSFLAIASFADRDTKTLRTYATWIKLILVLLQRWPWLSANCGSTLNSNNIGFKKLKVSKTILGHFQSWNPNTCLVLKYIYWTFNSLTCESSWIYFLSGKEGAIFLECWWIDLKRDCRIIILTERWFSLTSVNRFTSLSVDTTHFWC